uniref:Uncharacterized protein n=1 Tax=Panagrolaimus davidi TaxID=227884 RepID=A0A914PHF8_9BILA
MDEKKETDVIDAKEGKIEKPAKDEYQVDEKDKTVEFVEDEQIKTTKKMEKLEDEKTDKQKDTDVPQQKHEPQKIEDKLDILVDDEPKTDDIVAVEVQQTPETKDKIPTMEEFMADMEISEFINKLVETITTEAEIESEQHLKDLLSKQTELDEPRQTSPSPTKAILTLEEQLKQLQKDLDESGMEIPEGGSHELNIEKEFEKEVEREEALAEAARKRYSREPSEDTILEEPEIEETFEVISKQDVKLSKDNTKGQTTDTLPTSPTEFREIQIPEITLTNESGEPVIEMTTSITDLELITDEIDKEAQPVEAEATAPEVNIQITKEDTTFTYHLRIVQPQLLIVSAELSGTILSNQRIISVTEDITKIPDKSGIEVSVLSPALTKENVIYKWILKREGGGTEARDTWILNRVSFNF